MTKICIICGNPAGSAEHVFPAALGGRRTNRGIYCGPHNEGYSPLAAIIKDQLAIFNAQLGVVGDHSKEETAVTMTEVATNRPITMTASSLRFQAPQVLSQEQREDGSIVIEQSFSSQAEADAWVAAQRAHGHDVRIKRAARSAAYFPGTMHRQVTLGGTEEGLRSIAYIAQTFLAQAFPALARRPELQALKDYTLLNAGSGFVWWVFDPPADLPAAPYAFGHRIMVGHDSRDGGVYARVSLFGSLNFALLLGSVSTDASRAVVTDINPLVLRAPGDIQAKEFTTAIGAVSRPADPTQAFKDASTTGRAERELGALIFRIREFELHKTAGELMGAVTEASAKPEAERKADLAKIVEGQSQRLLMVMRKAASDMQSGQASLGEQTMSALLGSVLRPDPAAASGLSPEAARSLEIARAALVDQMDRELVGGTLDQDRLAMLIGGGPGAYTMLEALNSDLARRSV